MLQRTFSWGSAPKLFCTEKYSGKKRHPPTPRSWAVNNFTANNKNGPRIKAIERFIFQENIHKV